jgi:erythronate-4-phosphate dehydrogenase
VKILADASLPYLEQLFTPHFKLTQYTSPKMLHDALPSHDILLCRSTLKVTPNLLKNTQLSCVATATSGIDHIHTNYLNTQNIPLFDAKGCNADAVADYVMATLAYLKKYHGLPGKRVGIMGAGEVGSRVIERFEQLKFDIFAFDPFKPNFESCAFDTLKTCDILCIHANLHHNAPYPTQNALNQAFLEQLKSGTIIINAARGGILDETALLRTKQNILYCTDVYHNEPQINPDIIQYATLSTPHIAGHSIEAKFNAVFNLSKKLHQHFKLEPPKATQSTKISPKQTYDAWEDWTLSLYNPSHETNILKASANLEDTFLKLRRAHQYRHDFHWTTHAMI